MYVKYGTAQSGNSPNRELVVWLHTGLSIIGFWQCVELVEEVGGAK